MRISQTLGAAAIFLAACATAPPRELVDARAAFEHASTGPATALAPGHLAVARDQLAQAENAYASSPRSPVVRDLAYAAERQAEAADAAAGAEQARRDKAAAQAQLAAAATQNRQRALSAEQEARQAQQQAREAQQRAASESARLSAEEQARTEAEAAAAGERNARIRAEQQSAAAMRRLEEIASVREEARGRVITLNGSVLFASGTATILPSARQRLDDVALALEHEPRARFIVEGHTDSRGSDTTNLKLSDARAHAVREYLVDHGVDASRIVAVGKGEESPIATNATPEGRANNRRVEIVINRRQAER